MLELFQAIPVYLKIILSIDIITFIVLVVINSKH